MHAHTCLSIDYTTNARSWLPLEGEIGPPRDRDGWENNFSFIPFYLKNKIKTANKYVSFPGGSVVKNLPAKQETWVRSLKLPWRRAWQPTPVFLSGECHGQRSLVGYSPWGQKQLDMTEWLTFHRHDRNLHLINICPSQYYQNSLETPIMWYYASSFWEVIWEYIWGNKGKEMHMYNVSHLRTKLYIEYRRIICMCYI